MKFNEKTRTEFINNIYSHYHKVKFIHPDPLEFLFNYKSKKDREIVGIIASSLAYGRVERILISVDKILSVMGDSPYEFVKNTDLKSLKKIYSGFKHRFTDDIEIAELIYSMKEIIAEDGSLENNFYKYFKNDDETILDAMIPFTDNLKKYSSKSRTSLIPSPAKGSSCKRLCLFFRWMVRKDDIDPGGWSKIPTSKLIIPLDTHMHKMAKMLNITDKNQANMKTAIEITKNLSKYCKDDPVKYDFSLTRPGIHDKLLPEEVRF